MDSPDEKHAPDEKQPRSNPPVDKARPGDEQSQATIKEFDEEGMGVAPKE